jgi:hypothetical protein
MKIVPLLGRVMTRADFVGESGGNLLNDFVFLSVSSYLCLSL